MTKSFDDWFFSVIEGGYALRAEYFYEATGDHSSLNTLVEWLRAAYESGQQSVTDTTAPDSKSE